MAEVTDTFATPLRKMIPLLTILFVVNFHQKYLINKGFPFGDIGRVLVADSDRDGRLELIFGYYENYPHLVLYELGLDDTFRLECIIDTVCDNVWDYGDFDLDGLFDIVTQRSGITIFESPDSFSYPTQRVWWDVVGFPMVDPISTYDVDRDGLPELFKLSWKKEDSITVAYPFGVYECFGNNLYDTIFMCPDTIINTYCSTMAFGDFDNDYLNEFVIGAIDGRYSIYECSGNNTYVTLFVNVPLSVDIKDCFTLPDMDGDGKLEFVLKGAVHFWAVVQPFIFEATSNNTYEIIKSWTLPDAEGNWYAGGYSDTGDIDGDGRPEIALEAASYVYLIKGVSNDSFIIWYTLPGNPNGSSVRVFDIDNNGLSEIIISGGNYTRIYEKTPFVTWFCPTPYDTFYANDTVYPKWRLDETISLDSLRLYWSHPQLGCHLIYQGLATDTICSFVVPDTQSNMSNKFWLVTKGFGRYDSTYSPVFYIKRTPGIKENEISQFSIRNPKLTISPNPFRKSTVISYSPSGINDQLPSPTLQIYDATGRLVKRFDHSFPSGGIQPFERITWEGTDDSGCNLRSGVYFIRFTFDGYKKVAKEIKIN